jgi:cytosine/uracil/thiamine/allantoin permease
MLPKVCTIVGQATHHPPLEWQMSGDIVAGRPGGAQPVEEPGEYAAFKIEQRGIDLIPDSERKMRPSGLFWLWGGAVFNVEYLFYGTLIMTFANHFPGLVGSDFSWALGMVVGAGAYWLLARRGVRREAAQVAGI